MTTGSSDRPWPSCRYALSRKLPRGVGNTHSDTNLVVVVSSALLVGVSDPPSSSESESGVIFTSASRSTFEDTPMYDRGPLVPTAFRHKGGDEETSCTGSARVDQLITRVHTPHREQAAGGHTERRLPAFHCELGDTYYMSTIYRCIQNSSVVVV